MNDKNVLTRKEFNPDAVRAHYLRNTENLYAEMECNERRNKTTNQILMAIIWLVFATPVILIILNEIGKTAGHH